MLMLAMLTKKFGVIEESYASDFEIPSFDLLSFAFMNVVILVVVDL